MSVESLLTPAAASVKSLHAMPFGAEMRVDGSVRFSLWAPRHERIELQWRLASRDSSEQVAMSAAGDGWHRLIQPDIPAGTCYRFVLPDGFAVPDPASRHQPRDVQGPSEVIDPAAHHWRDQGWRGRAWQETVIYELHVGTFSHSGTFLGVIEHLDHLVDLGVTALELMPIADFPGRRNWGYDGVLPFAPDASYGRPEHLKALIDAAHARGLQVFLDVVYNHFGPEGNYLSLYAPQFFNPNHQTPWGAAVNFDAPGSEVVREFFIHNALYWLEEFHLDGLRLDAVHAIIDDSRVPVIEELARRVRAARWHRAVHLIIENEHNEARWLQRDPQQLPRLYDAQWNDDTHHVLHVCASDESEGYYADYSGDTDKLGRALAQGFAFQGELMPYRGSVRGEPSAQLPPSAFVAFLQNHDQIGNRAFGERLTAIACPQAIRAVTALYLLLPQIPMLFMGEEWHSQRPFQFFCDFAPDLAAAVRSGRRQEFARFAAFRDPLVRERIPDPQAEQTFLDSKLDWPRLRQEEHAGVLRWYRELLEVRRRHIVPMLASLTQGASFKVIGDGAVCVHWQAGTGAKLALQANLRVGRTGGFASEPGTLLWQEGQVDADGVFGPWSLRWSLRA